jgi:metal-dependent amidase/aminoacylase/carboxypeptidase family protein
VSKAANMQIPHLINLLQGEMTAWRHDLYAHPEPGFEEHRTSEFAVRLPGSS